MASCNTSDQGISAQIRGGDDKTEEFKNRKTYDVEHSVLKHEKVLVEEIQKVETPVGKQILLFTTKTCPNCKMAKMLLEKAGINYTLIDAEEQVEETKKYDVKKAPTLLVPNGDSYERFDNVSFIKKFIEDQKC